MPNFMEIEASKQSAAMRDRARAEFEHARQTARLADAQERIAAALERLAEQDSPAAREAGT